jgi:hypothetical protein
MQHQAQMVKSVAVVVVTVVVVVVANVVSVLSPMVMRRLPPLLQLQLHSQALQ